MKPLQVNGLGARAGRTISKKTKSRTASAPTVSPPFADQVALLRVRIAPVCSHFVGPVVALALLVVACFTLPIRSFSASRPALVTNAVFEIPAMRPHASPESLIFWLFANSALLGVVYFYWRQRFHLASPHTSERRFALRLILTVPAFTGLLWATVISRSDLGGHTVAESLAMAGIIATCLLTASVLGRSAATMTAAILVTLLGLLNLLPAWAIAAALAGALAGQYPARFLRHRVGVVRCAALVMAACVIGAFVTALFTGREIGTAASLGVLAMLNGCLGAAIWFTLLTMMERPYQLTTPLGLLELLDPTRPILAQFAREAPGTFAHSLMVGHLAASAAEAIGADPLLCRVAAQYHDLGKMRRAQFFVENQSDENVHDRLAPSLSALIVNSHVREGEKMAKEQGLPPVISDIIMQHHGTTLMRYFFSQASAGVKARDLARLQHHFRYPGPKPQTKEAGIMMLADAIEAASRTLAHPTRESVRTLIDSIVDDRINDDQLDECPLTLKDLRVVRETLTDVVCAMMHQRVEYPAPHICSEEAPQATIDLYEDFDPAIVSAIDEIIGESDEHPLSLSAITGASFGAPRRFASRRALPAGAVRFRAKRSPHR